MILPAFILLTEVPVQSAPMIPAPPAPPAPPPAYITTPSAMPYVQYSVDVEVRAGADRLYAGTLAVGTPVTSSFRQDIVEASTVQCPSSDGDDQTRFPNGTTRATARNTSFQLSLNPGYQNNGNRLQVTVRWSRPVGESCLGRSNSRVVELTDWVVLPPHGSATLTGDAGLVIRLTRR